MRITKIKIGRGQLVQEEGLVYPGSKAPTPRHWLTSINLKKLKYRGLSLLTGPRSTINSSWVSWPREETQTPKRKMAERSSLQNTKDLGRNNMPRLLLVYLSVILTDIFSNPINQRWAFQYLTQRRTDYNSRQTPIKGLHLILKRKSDSWGQSRWLL